jgi:hypothetical protein
MKKYLNKFLGLLFFFLLAVCTGFSNGKPQKEIYQLTVYKYTTAEQEAALDDYLKNALLPSLHRNGYKNIGVFKSLANDTMAVKSLFVFLPLKNMEAQAVVLKKLDDDAVYQSAGAAYLNALYTNAPYARMEIILLKAFPLAPQMQLPKLAAEKKERVYELRSYESATEKIFKNKVKMFNEGGEISFFKQLNFNAVFYAEVVAGAHMPNLMYMTCFENKADRDLHWKNFVEDPFWKKLSAMPEYQHNVSRNDISFLQPTDYSDF